jgi:broad specificity phosphatase PhoE
MKPIMKSTAQLLPIFVAIILTVALGANGAKANAQEVVFLVQYGEVDLAYTGLSDVGLSEEGRRRATALANLLKDAGINVIYSFERPHVIQTAEPTAKALNIKVNVLPFKIEARDDLVRRLRTEHGKDRVFIATGTPSRDHILKAYGFTKEVWKEPSATLFVIVPRGREEPRVIKMRW